MISGIQSFLLKIIDIIYAIIPRSLPNSEFLKQCKIVSHRGEHNNKTVFENTIPAFDKVLIAGVWGIELDIRWTKDLQPIVIHDPDCNRLFKKNIETNKITLSELKTQIPLIPSLKEIIEKYGKKLHLMVEIKRENYPDNNLQRETLRNLFNSLIPEKDYHFISLDIEMFHIVNFVPNSALLPVSELNYKKLSKTTIDQNYGGLTGYFLFLSEQILRKDGSYLKVGTGFIWSKNCLFRELNRRVEWIFSNHAIKLQNIVNNHVT